MHRKQIGYRAGRSFIKEPSQKDIGDLMARRFKRELINKGIIPNPATREARYRFTWSYGNLLGEVYADNRSLARSLIKQELGIRKKNRLPVEVEITREDNTNEDSTGGSEEGSNCDDKRAETCTVV